MTVVLLTIALSWTPPLQRKFVRGAFPRVADPSLLIASQGGNGGGGGSGGGTITFDNDKMLALGDSLKKLELIFFSPTSLAIIMMCILPITLLWLTDHPERVNVEGTPKLLSLRLHAALDILGFFSHFGLVTAIFLTTEVAMTLSHGTIWAGHQPLVKLMVAYTGASHFLYGVHALAVGFLPDRFARLRDFLSMGLGNASTAGSCHLTRAAPYACTSPAPPPFPLLDPRLQVGSCSSRSAARSRRLLSSSTSS